MRAHYQSNYRVIRIPRWLWNFRSTLRSPRPNPPQWSPTWCGNVSTTSDWTSKNSRKEKKRVATKFGRIVIAQLRELAKSYGTKNQQVIKLSTAFIVSALMAIKLVVMRLSTFDSAIEIWTFFFDSDEDVTFVQKLQYLRSTWKKVVCIQSVSAIDANFTDESFQDIVTHYTESRDRVKILRKHNVTSSML